MTSPEHYIARTERVRGTIPAELLIRIASIATLTGKMPAFDEEGKMTGVFEDVDAKTRLATCGKLLDKALPATLAKPEDMPAQITNEADEMKLLSNEELRALAYGA